MGFLAWIIIFSLPCFALSERRHIRMGSSRDRSITSEERLIKNLLSDYDTDARSVIDTAETVTVSIQFLLLRIQRLDERSQILMTTGLILTDWTDQRLIWNPGKYNNITDIVVRAGRIWTPELAVINGADDMIQEFEKIRVLIKSDGSVHWEPGGVFTTTCDIDITYFPFDTQACEIEIGAWAYTSLRMNLSNSDFKMETGEYKQNGEWNIYATTARWKEVVLPSGPEISYSKVVFTIHMHRRFAFYVVNIILPCALLSTLILMVFCVPPDAGEKISAGISVLLAYTVFLLMLADNVPRTSLDVPILVIYLASSMSLGTASVCLTVLVLNLHHKGSTKPVPSWARSFLLQKCSRFLLLSDVYIESNASNPEEQYKQRITSRPPQYSNDYIIAGKRHRIFNCNSSSNKDKHNCNSRRRCESDDNNSLHSILDETLQYQNLDRNGMERKTKYSRRIKSEEDLKNEAIAKEWQMLALVMDRIFFIVISLAMFGSASLILLSPWYAKTFPMPEQPQ